MATGNVYDSVQQRWDRSCLRVQIERKALYESIDAVRKRSFVAYSIMAGLLCFTAERSPAPIVETPDKPTPAPPPQQEQQTFAPKEKHSTKPKFQSPTTVKTQQHQSAPTSGAARFSGSWSGRLPQPFQGMVDVSFFINAEGTSVRMKEGERPAVVNGNAVTWKSGWLTEI